MIVGMNAIARIRKSRLKLSQAAFAAALGVSQSAVSRWETGETELSLSEMNKIRDLAAARGIAWNNDWFFETSDTLPDT
jgi:DNA-binding transcriptional regulator YiaG